MMTTICILLIENAFTAWLFTNSPYLGMAVVLAGAVWFVAIKYSNHEHRFDKIESQIGGIKDSQKASGKRITQVEKRIGKVEDRLGRIEGQLNIVIMMLKRNKTSSGDETQTNQQKATHLTPNR